MAVTYNLNSIKDFEIIWIDKFTGLPKDLDDVTMEIYHYEPNLPAEVVSSFPEPYILTETFNDVLNITSIYCPSGYVANVPNTLPLDLIGTDFTSGWPPSEFVVCGTNSNISIVNGYTKYALSAFEVASLINVNASGYTASDRDGFVVLQSIFDGSESILEVGEGSINQTLGLNIGDVFTGENLRLVHDLGPLAMDHLSQGRYIHLNVELTSPPYTLEERYYVLYKGFDPSTSKQETHQEDFIVGAGYSGSRLSYHFSCKD